MNTDDMRGRILEILGSPAGLRDPISSASIAMRLGIDWRTAPGAYERVGKMLSKMKRAGEVELMRGKGWRLA